MTTEQSYLAREVDILYRQLFTGAAPSKLAEAYIRAHAEIPDINDSSEGELRTVRTVVEHRLDAIGIEPWLRSKQKRHLLFRKLLLISYIAECDGAHPEYRHEARGRTNSFASLLRSGVLGAIRLIRGRFQKAYYELL